MKILIVTIYLSLITKVFSHPHVFFDASFLININQNTIQNISVDLSLDEMNTLVYQEELAPENDGKVKKENIHFLKDVINHFHLSYNNSQPIKNNFIFESAFIIDNKLNIHIVFPLNKKLTQHDKIVFSMYDKEYYYTYDYNEYSLEDNIINSTLKINSTLMENRAKSFYFGMIYPLEFEVVFN